ncbi:superoxide dismutase [Streptomyces sp. NPDC002817]|uniref:superoxide dismutase n=1 Tax=Streptomyces sp. NPDC088357 TaxID=3154655 RepID=UPI0034387F63
MTGSLARRQLLGTGIALGATALIGGTAQAAPGTARSWPKEFSLPNGWGPEGVAIGSAPYAYFGSIATGGVYRVDLASGKGMVVHRGLGRMTVGLKTDSWGRLFLAGGSSGELRVVDAHSGALLANHVVAGENSFVNDVLLTRDAAWFTESFSAQLFKLPLGRQGRIGAPESLTLSGDWVQSGFTSNGISLTPDGSALLVTNAAADGGSLMRVNPRTGVARKVDLGDTTLPSGDGLVLVGRTLYVVQPNPNQVDVIRLNRSGTRGTAVGVIRDDRFDLPTTAAAYQGRLYLPNSRFTTPGRDENTPYNAVSVPLV